MIPIGNGAEMYVISIRELFNKVATIQDKWQSYNTQPRM